MRLLRYGPHALLAEVGSTEEALALYAAALSAGVPAAEVVPAARTVLFDGVEDPAALAGRLRHLEPAAAPAAAPGDVVRVPTVYDGPDVEEVARQWDTTPDEVVVMHTATEFTVAFCGFSPGFGYCTGLPDRLEVTRRATPRARVPAGSVAVAGPFTAVYPSASPGGWQLLGRTELPMWDPTAEQPARLAPGTRVRFVEVTR